MTHGVILGVTTAIVLCGWWYAARHLSESRWRTLSWLAFAVGLSGGLVVIWTTGNGARSALLPHTLGLWALREYGWRRYCSPVSPSCP